MTAKEMSLAAACWNDEGKMLCGINKHAEFINQT
jgi:hypothetical protein